MEEIEVKFLDIDKDLIESKLKALGAVKEFDRILKRRIYDFPDLRLNEIGAYIRVRDENDKITFTYKRRIGMAENGENDKGMEEIETTVGDFNMVCGILEKVGLTEKLNEEQRRIRYRLGDIIFDIDFWPLLNPYLEIEAPSWEKVNEGIKMLGLNPEDKKIFTSVQVYKQKGLNELSYKKLTFAEQIKK